MEKNYDCVVTWQEDSLTEVALKHNWDTQEEAENWIFETMFKAVKNNSNIENVSADWECGGMGKTFQMLVGF